MQYISPNNHQLLLRRFSLSDSGKLSCYWCQLSHATRSRFAPHPFDILGLRSFYANEQAYKGYIAIDKHTQQIIAYAVLKIGCWEQDVPRLQAYGLTINPSTDASFAPSVADNWQGQGIGSQMLQFIKKELQAIGINRLMLWGGVQARNGQAVQYYKRQGFTLLGRFEHHGQNEDRVLTV